MTMTPEQAAQMIVGKYDIFKVISRSDFRRWEMQLHNFMLFLYDRDIWPCMKCGAYRLADSCQICDDAGKVVVT